MERCSISDFPCRSSKATFCLTSSFNFVRRCTCDWSCENQDRRKDCMWPELSWLLSRKCSTSQILVVHHRGAFRVCETTELYFIPCYETTELYFIPCYTLIGFLVLFSCSILSDINRFSKTNQQNICSLDTDFLHHFSFKQVVAL